MNKNELAKLLGVSVKTMYNWEKEKPELVRLINQGLALDEIIANQKKNLEELENMKETANNGKFKLK